MSIADFTGDPVLRELVAAEIAEVFAGTDYLRPDVGDVIADAIRLVRYAARTDATSLAVCEKVDDCTATALVLGRFADWLEES